MDDVLDTLVWIGVGIAAVGVMSHLSRAIRDRRRRRYIECPACWEIVDSTTTRCLFCGTELN